MPVKELLPCWVLLAVLISGCGDAAAPSKPGGPPTPVAPVDTSNPPITAAELRRRLGANEQAAFREDGGRIVGVQLAGSGVTDLSPLAGLPIEVLDLRGLDSSDLSPLKGLPLRELYAEETQVRDLSPLAGLPLAKLYLSDTRVSDLSPLAGMELEELNLVGTRVRNVEPLANARLGTLWLRNTSVHDLTPLAATGLVSLDIEGTPVNDLRPLAEMTSLRRLNIARSAVQDLTPLAGLQLQRLVFTPSQITAGLDVVREMPSLTALGTRFEEESDTLPPAEFWRKLDAGEIK